MSNHGLCSWYDFAKEILKDGDVAVSFVTSEEYPQKAYRLRHSVMSLDKVKASGFEIQSWEEALKTFLNNTSN